jgi:integrase/recombinase XerD
MTISDAINLFLRDRKTANCRPGTLGRYESALARVERHLTDVEGLAHVAEMKPQHFNNYLATRVTGKSAAARNDRAIIMVWLAWLRDQDAVPSLNWSKRIPPIKIDQPEPVCLGVEDIPRLLDAILNQPGREDLPKYRDYAIVLLMLDTGMREGEVVRMEGKHLSLAKQEIKVTNQAKGRRGRIVWFGERTARAIASYLELRKEIEYETERVFVNRSGGSLTEHALYTNISAAGRRAGLEGVTVHCLRHTAATLMLSRGMPLESLRKTLGHADIKLTLRYTHLRDKDVERDYRAASPLDGLDV